jgi:hypothetical protein
METFEGEAVTNVSYSLDGTTMYITLKTGLTVELHGRTQTRITRFGMSQVQSATRTFILHNLEGPSRISVRGHRVHRMWYIEGTRMSEKEWRMIVNKTVTMEDVMHAGNAEVRMLMISALGVDKLQEHATLIDTDEDECGRPIRLWEYIEESQSQGHNLQRDVIRIRFIEVYNSSPPHERFLLYVPPSMSKAREAVAWTFPYEAEGFEYNPDTSS